ncbi:hypothetical protein B0H17DRAFT_1147263 [Mycena rosella]|uniref:Uncharacterized protein n=1 Tax=Mycena rosella TaxID=1033263 RepID=A0AAD7FZZ3_MYCRO|nr:hypothetical protein B0H17DRAFT_1147263 [Mycena rosella]
MAQVWGRGENTKEQLTRGWAVVASRVSGSRRGARDRVKRGQQGCRWRKVRLRPLSMMFDCPRARRDANSSVGGRGDDAVVSEEATRCRGTRVVNSGVGDGHPRSPRGREPAQTVAAAPMIDHTTGSRDRCGGMDKWQSGRKEELSAPASGGAVDGYQDSSRACEQARKQKENKSRKSPVANPFCRVWMRKGGRQCLGDKKTRGCIDCADEAHHASVTWKWVGKQRWRKEKRTRKHTGFQSPAPEIGVGGAGRKRVVLTLAARGPVFTGPRGFAR